MKRLLYITAALIIFPSVLSGQNKISGTVIDAKTRNPISNVAVFVEDQSGVGSYTDSKGKFSFDVNKYPLVLSLTSVGYHRRDIGFGRAPGRDLDLELFPETMEMNEVAITGERYLQFLKKENFYVRDYAFGESYIWIIGYPEKNMQKTELRVMSFTGDVLDIIPTNRRDRFFCDVFENVHLVSKDSVHQLFFDGEQIDLLYGQVKAQPYEDLVALQMLNPQNAVLKEVKGVGNLNEYWMYQLSDSTKELLHSSFDRDLFDSKDQAARYNHGPIPGWQGSFAPPIQVSEDRKLWEMRQANWEMKIWSDERIKNYIYETTGRPISHAAESSGAANPFTLYGLRRMKHKPIVSRFFTYEDHMVIFEDRDQLVWVYQDTKTQADFFHCGLPESGTDLNMVQDKTDNSLYVSYAVAGRYYVAKIDPLRELVIKTVDLKGFSFVENIQVHGGRVYFMHQNPMGSRAMNLYSFIF